MPGSGAGGGHVPVCSGGEGGCSLSALQHSYCEGVGSWGLQKYLWGLHSGICPETEAVKSLGLF